MEEKAKGKRIFVKPKNKDVTVRFPGMPRRILSPKGEWVDNSPNWQRLLRDGDVVTDEKKDEGEHKKDEAKEVKKEGAHK